MRRRGFIGALGALFSAPVVAKEVLRDMGSNNVEPNNPEPRENRYIKVNINNRDYFIPLWSDSVLDSEEFRKTQSIIYEAEKAKIDALIAKHRPS